MNHHAVAALGLWMRMPATTPMTPYSPRPLITGPEPWKGALKT